MSFLSRLGKALGKIAHTAEKPPATAPPILQIPSQIASVHAREMLEQMRRGEYEFSGTEVSEIIRKSLWLGARQSWFEELVAVGDSQIEVRLKVPQLGNISLVLLIVDLWHDQRVSSIDFQILKLSVEKMRGMLLGNALQRILIFFIYTALRWNGSWQDQAFRFVLRTTRTVRIYIEWPEKKSPLIGHISVIGARIRENVIVFYTFRRSSEMETGFNLLLPDKYSEPHPTALSRIAVLFSWILLGAYAFVLVHVTLPVLSGAFQLMPQGATAFHIWVLTQIYNLCVILLSYFFLRITMLPLYLKWNKSKEDLETLISLEERDHQYLRPLTELTRKMQQANQTIRGNETAQANTLAAGTISQMLELMSTIREQSRQRLLGMTRMRRGWVQDLLIGYLFIFSLEWLYYKGLLTPLSVSIKWVNRVMVGLFLAD
jgi:hypothetical protein